MSEQDVNVLREAYDAFNRGDIPAVLEVFDADIEWQEPDVEGLWYAGLHRGRDAVANEVFAGVPEHFEEFSVDAEEFLDAGDRVVVLGAFRGRAKGGGELTSPFAHVWTLAGGKAVRFQNYEDTANFLAALGKQPATA